MAETRPPVDGGPAGVAIVAARERLLAHVEAVLARSHVPSRDRGDVAEELLGHLRERYEAAIDSGATAEVAADEAIAAFGAAVDLGPAFVRAYHSRLWASTIGALLPVDADRAAAPGVIVWTIRLFRVLAAFSVLGGFAALALLPPVRAFATALLTFAGGAGLVLIAEGLRRRQPWTVGLTALVLAIEVGTFLLSLRKPAGGWNVEVFGMAAIFLAAGWLAQDAAVGRWLTGEGRPRGLLLAAIAIAMAGWGLAGVAAQRLPDPTQIGPDDIEAVASVTCAPQRLEDGQPTVPAPTVQVEVRYRRTDVLPLGILRISEDAPDHLAVEDDHMGVSGFQPVPLDEGSAVWFEQLTIGQAGDFSGDFIDASGSRLVAGIPRDEQRSDQPIRVGATSVMNVGDGRPAGEVGTPLPGSAVRVRLAHLDRFVLGADVPCGERLPLAVSDDEPGQFAGP